MADSDEFLQAEAGSHETRAVLSAGPGALPDVSLTTVTLTFKPLGPVEGTRPVPEGLS